MAASDPIWQLLQKSNDRLAHGSISGLFDADARRAQRYSLEVGDLFVDFSRHGIDDQALAELYELARVTELERGREMLASGARLNESEDRSAGHTRLRSEGLPETHACLEKIITPLVQQRWLGATGQPIDCLVNIGIGGSDLGPRGVVDALGAYRQDGVQVEFLANVDGESITALLPRLDPARTGFCVTSKSFSTDETLTNAASARAWLRESLGAEDVSNHFVAVTGRPDRARDFGIDAIRVLPLADEIGGRYSLWSTVGLPIAAAIGLENFRELLLGAASMDRHFFEAPSESNLPVTLALLSLWYRNVFGCGSYAVVPYDRRLRWLPAYLQQLDMESLGKGVKHDGSAVERATGAICWGGEGTKGQHAFFQWLHQSPDRVPVELVAARTSHHSLANHHRKLLANMVSQATALMQGRDLEATRLALISDGLGEDDARRLSPHCQFSGNRPSTIVLLERLTPRALGSLLALYEHRVFCQAWIWGINPFDQWGVELGKRLAGGFERVLQGEEPPEGTDPAALQLLKRLRSD